MASSFKLNIKNFSKGSISKPIKFIIIIKRLKINFQNSFIMGNKEMQKDLDFIVKINSNI